MYDVIAIGSNVVDVFVETDAELIEIKTQSSEQELIAYPLGSKILIKHLDFMIGGGGTNTAVSFSRLGFNTAYLGKVGKDENGLKIFQSLKNEGIEFIGVLGHTTGYSIILDSFMHDRTILTYRGCNDNLFFSEIKKEALGTKWFFTSAMIGESFRTLERLAGYAEENGIKMAMNVNTYLAKKGSDFLGFLFKKLDILILNKKEAGLIVGEKSIKQMLAKLVKMGPKIVVITAGPEGAYCYAQMRYYHVPPKPVKIKETTGAGDAFASTFVTGVMMKKDIKICLRMAAINSESVIQNYGAKNILMNKEQLFKELKKDRRKITTIRGKK